MLLSHAAASTPTTKAAKEVTKKVFMSRSFSAPAAAMHLRDRVSWRERAPCADGYVDMRLFRLPSLFATPEELLAWLASLPPGARDAAVDEHLGIAGPSPCGDGPPGDHLIGYHASGVAAIARALVEVPVGAEDVLVDLGAGLGKVVLLAHLFTGARARGVELQPPLVNGARAAAARLGCSAIDVSFTEADARVAELDDGTVFFLYAPFTGPVLAEVVRRLQGVARRHAIVVCALGVDLHPAAPWLVARPIDSFWLTVYDGVAPGVPPRSQPAPSKHERTLRTIALERWRQPSRQ
jgi:hypothetical protein